MLFAIISGKPYLISLRGTAIPVKIIGDSVTTYDSMEFRTDAIGCYTLAEIHAKYGDTISSVEEKKKRVKKGDDE